MWIIISRKPNDNGKRSKLLIGNIETFYLGKDLFYDPCLFWVENLFFWCTVFWCVLFQYDLHLFWKVVVFFFFKKIDKKKISFQQSHILWPYLPTHSIYLLINKPASAFILKGGHTHIRITYFGWIDNCWGKPAHTKIL